jgi:hypothetical protein
VNSAQKFIFNFMDNVWSGNSGNSASDDSSYCQDTFMPQSNIYIQDYKLHMGMTAGVQDTKNKMPG